MRTIATTFERHTGETRGLMIKVLGKKSLLSRFRYLILSTDWDVKVLAGEKWIDRICLVFIALSALYLIPVLILR